MKKRTFKLLLVAMAVTIVALMGAGQIMAQGCDPPMECTTSAGYKVWLAENPVPVGEGLWAWTYRFQKPSGGRDVSHIDISIPVCCPNEIAISEGDYRLDLYPAASGEPSTGFGKYLWEVFVAKFTPEKSLGSGVWYFYSNSGNMTDITVLLKAGTTVSSCKIAGPGCGDSLPQMAVSVEQIITNKDGEIIRIIEDPYTQCIENVQKWNPTGDNGAGAYEDLTMVLLKTALKATNNDSPLEFLGVPGQACSRAIVKSQGNETWYYVSGRWVWY